ncbi:S8 family peptidase [Cohnella faecalis]|uniref:Peptidase S8 n=1 Tax=Cohnella faecalis TaxID=2315694 RepID=A0A398CNP3_9BACL|nr:S8 family peptidase [Cohnella faecalis]RIE04223.1 peptidase S8 [Cohnella faecalis]
MRRRYALLGLLFTAAVALFVVPLFAPPAARTPSPPSTSSLKQAAASKELTYKHSSIKRDMQETERLSRKQSVRDAVQYLDGKSDATVAARTGSLERLLRTHPEMQAVAWVKGSQTVAAGSPAQGLRKAAEPYWKHGENAIRSGRAYTSSLFAYEGKSHFVLAQPASDGKSGLVMLLSASVVQEVERHQRRNLRVVPYPAEGRYRIESVLPNTTKDITVKTGEDNGNASHYSVDEVVVKFKKPLDNRQLLQIRKELHLTVVRHLKQTYVFRSKKHSAEQLMKYFQKYDPVYVEPHYLYLTNELPDERAANDSSTIVPNDTLYSEYQWNLPEIATEQGWNVSKGSKDIVVAVVDTGVQSDHPDLKGRLVAGTNIVDPSSPPDDDVGHGTHVAGIIAAEVNNGEGVAGMTWFTKIMPVKVLDSTGAGSTYSVAEGVVWAVDHGANVINLSLGNYADAEFMHDALKYAYDHGVVLVAASGNDNTDRPGYPAAYPEVLGVAATDPNEARAEYSNYGDYIDIAAPGTSIASTYPGSRYASLSGTSMACPHVSALASLVRAANPKMTNAEVMDVLRRTAKDLGSAGKDASFGYGQIDVKAALQAAGGTSSSLQLYPRQVKRDLERIMK